MRKSIRRKSVGRHHSRKNPSVNPEEIPSSVNSKPKAKDTSNSTMNAFYQSGPMVPMPALYGAANQRESGKNNLQSMLVPSSLPPISGKGTPSQDYAMASSVSLDGRTDAEFDGGSFSTENVRVSSAEGCSGCSEGDPCIRARGTLVARYHVTTTVTLPSVDDFPDLTACQRERVQNAIDTVLAPHEQEHVRAFNQYNGVVRTPFNLVLCRSDFDSTIQDMFEQQATARRDSAQAASDALDPFRFNVDINCEEPEADSEAESESSAPVEESAGGDER